ncbi:MAG: hypothetical protein GY796_23630 [Chloroflexi bacterium]|nr:hypothetical protein [Chloroflexota bacterium]
MKHKLRQNSLLYRMRRNVRRKLELMGVIPNPYIPNPLLPDDTFIGMGTVVTNDVPACVLVGDNTSQILGFQDRELFLRLNEQGKYY